VAALDGNTLSSGVFQSSAWRISPTWRWTQFIIFLQNAHASADRRLRGQASLSGAIHGPFSMNLAYIYDRENAVQTGNTEVNQNVSVGLQVRF
jgi:hypothetical protein